MALLEDVVKLEGVGAPAAAIGVGVLLFAPRLFPALLLAPRLLPTVGRALRPVAKEVVKVGITAYDAAQATVSGAYQATGDLIAEARQEREQESGARHSSEKQTLVHKKGEGGRHELGGLAGQPA